MWTRAHNFLNAACRYVEIEDFMEVTYILLSLESTINKSSSG